MPRFPDLGSFPSIDFSNLDLSKLTAELPSFNLPKVDFSKVEFPKIDFSGVDLPAFDLPDVDLPEIDADRIAGFARDAAYVGVGLTVLAVQQAQVRRRELQATIERNARKLADAVG